MTSIPFWWCTCLGCAGILSLSAQHSINEDGLSYLDLASAAVNHGLSGLLNGYWSPGYPALLSVFLALFRPSPSQELPLVHFVNFLIFALTLLAFDFFLRSWLLSQATGLGPKSDQKRRGVLPFVFCTFLWFTLEYIGVTLITPDLCVAAIVFLVAGITCRLSLVNSTIKHYFALGLALGLGYYIKAAMFPLGLFFCAILLSYPPSPAVTRRRLFLSVVVFLLMAAPLVTALSGRLGKLSFGDTAKLNYAWYVNGLWRYTGWTGGAADDHGSPEHPPRTLMQKPLTLEFDGPIEGTFPLAYDPSYWYAGAVARFSLYQQIAALRNTWRVYRIMFSQMAVLFSGALILFIAIIRGRHVLDPQPREVWQLIWPLTAMFMYGLVHVETRFLGAFFVLLWLAIYGGLMSRLNGMNTRVALAVCSTVACTVMIPLMDQITIAGLHALRDLVRSTQPAYKTVGVGLRNLGVRRGDRLAVVGYAYDSYFARYAGLRVVAEIPSADEFWKLSTEELKSVEEQLEKIGVKAIVAKDRPNISAPANWLDVTASNSARFSILLLSDPANRDSLK